MTKVYVSESGEKLVARDEIQEAAFKKAGLKEDKTAKVTKIVDN